MDVKPYSPGKPVEEVRRELGLARIVKLASNENVLGPSPKALQALRAAVSRVAEYPEGSCPALREKLSQRLGLAEDQIVFGAGSDEIIHLICLAFLNPGDEVVTGHPSFVIYDTNTRLFGGKLHLVPLKNFVFDLEGMLARVNRKTKIVFIANPNNPTGTIVRGRELRRFLQALPPRVITVLDEAYVEYVEDPAFESGLRFLRRHPVIVLRTFSKIYGLAGLRIGYGVGPRELIQYCERVREPFNVNRLAQAAAEAALDDHEHVEKSRLHAWREKRFLVEKLGGLGIEPVPSEANFLFFDTGVDSRALFQKLLRRGIIVRTGDVFGYPTFIRLTFGRRTHHRELLAAFYKFKNEMSRGSRA